MVSEEELAKEIVTELLKRYSKHGMTKEEARTYGARFEGVTRSENEHVRRVWYDNHLKSILQKAANSGDNKAQACLQGRFYEEVKEKKQDEKTKRKQAKAQEKTAKAQLETAEAEKAAAPLKLFPHGAFDVLIIVGIINHLSDWWFWGFQKTGMSFLFDFLIAFFTFLFAFGPFNDKGNINVKGASACIVAWFIEVELFPMLGSRIIGTSTPTLIKVLLAKHLWPVWVFFGLMYTGKTEGGFTWIAKFARWCLAVFWIFILITPMKAYMMDAYLEDMSEEQREEVFGAVTESFNESKTSWAAVWECWRHSIFGLGAGQAGAYEKCIEEKRNPPEKQTQYEVARSEDSIIVALKPIKSKKTFKAEEDIKVSAVFEIKSESKDVKIEGASCSFNKGPKGKEEKVVQGVAKFEGRHRGRNF